VIAYYGSSADSTCPVNVQVWREVCNYEYVTVWGNICSWDYVYDYGTGTYSYQEVCAYGPTTTYENVCRDQLVWEQQPGPVSGTVSGNTVSAKDHAATYTLGTVTSGTSPDFLLALMTATRTTAGAQHDMGTFTSAIPANKIAANGSTVLESAFEPGGASWLSRIVSVYLDGDSVKAEFKHSNRQYVGWTDMGSASVCGLFPPDASAAASNTSSTWSIIFEVYVGKFTT